jgi:phage terminase small subunit
MAQRGPKPRTADNARPGHKELIRHDSLEPPCELSRAARKEYDRLLGVLRDKGTLDRVDLSCVAECARIKTLLDLAHKDAADSIDWEKAKLVGLLSGQHRGRLRELGLTTRPHLSVVKSNPVPAEDDPVAGFIKLSG